MNIECDGKHEGFCNEGCISEEVMQTMQEHRVRIAARLTKWLLRKLKRNSHGSQ
jgi:hypothetical protein